MTFVGRGAELARLGDYLDALWRSPAETPAGVRAGGSVVMLVGEAGIGKTAVARRFGEMASARGATVLWGTSTGGDAGAPNGPWSDALEPLLRASPPAVLREQLGAGAPALARAMPAVRGVLPDTPPASPLDPLDERLRFWDAVSRWLRRAAEVTPIVLVLDALDAADTDTLRLLRHVARSSGRSPLLLLCTYREQVPRRGATGPLVDALAALRTERPYHRIRLNGFGPEDVGTLLGDRTRVRLGASGLREMTRVTRGNPFYIDLARRLLLDTWASEDAPTRPTDDVTVAAAPRRPSGGYPIDGERDRPWSAPDDEESDPEREWSWSTRPEIPQRRNELLDRRIARRSQDAASVLRALVVVPGPVTRDLVRPVTELPAERVLDGLDELVAAGLANVTGTGASPEWDLTHELIRDAFDDRLTVARRAHLHRRVAETLERLVAGHEREAAASLGWHYRASAASPGAERGVRFLVLAAEAARGAYAHVRAATLLRMALEIAPRDDIAGRADLLERLAQAEADAGLAEHATQTAEEAVRVMGEARVPSERIVGLLADVVRVLERSGAPESTWRPLVDRGMALLRGARDRQWARLSLGRDAVVPLAEGPVLHAGRWRGRDAAAVKLLLASPVEDDRADALHPLDARTEAESEALLTSLRTWRRPAAQMAATAVGLRDLVATHGAYRLAVEVASALLESAQRHGAIAVEAAALLDLAICDAVVGDLEAAGRAWAAAEQRRGAMGPRAALDRHALEVRLVLAGYTDDDWHAVARALDRRIGDPAGVHDPQVLPLTAWAVLAAVRLGRPDAARERFPAVVELLARTTASVPGHADALVIACAAAWELGAADQAGALRTLASDLPDAALVRHPLGSPRHAIARMTTLLGHGDEAISMLEHERAAVDRAGYLPLAALVTMDLAAAIESSGGADPARVDALRADAGERFAAIGFARWAARVSVLRGGGGAGHGGAGARRAGAAAGATGAGTVTFPDGLTTREVDVLRLLVTNADAAGIARELFLDPAVAERHAANVRAKTGLQELGALRDYAIRHGLVTAGG